MTYEIHPDKRDAGVTGEADANHTETASQTLVSRAPRTAIEDVVMRQNSEFYQERILTYGSWENFLDAHGLMYKAEKEDAR